MVSGDRSHTAVLHRRTIKGKLNLNNQNKYNETNSASAETSCNKGIALYGQGKYYRPSMLMMRPSNWTQLKTIGCPLLQLFDINPISLYIVISIFRQETYTIGSSIKMALSIRENISFTCPSCRNYVLFIPYQDPVGCLKDQFPTCPNCGTALERHKLEILIY